MKAILTRIGHGETQTLGELDIFSDDDNLIFTCKTLELEEDINAVRDDCIPKGPIFISSGYRSPHLNISIGGISTSQHCKGEALDLDADGYNYKLFNYIFENLDFDQLIWEFGDDKNPAWVHVSYKIDENRNQVLKAYKDEQGRTKYKEL